jgi:hypothetical protein
MSLLKNAEEQIGDADISKIVARLERRMARIHVEEPGVEIEDGHRKTLQIVVVSAPATWVRSNVRRRL